MLCVCGPDDCPSRALPQALAPRLRELPAAYVRARWSQLQVESLKQGVVAEVSESCTHACFWDLLLEGSPLPFFPSQMVLACPLF